MFRVEKKMSKASIIESTDEIKELHTCRRAMEADKAEKSPQRLIKSEAIGRGEMMMLRWHVWLVLIIGLLAASCQKRHTDRNSVENLLP